MGWFTSIVYISYISFISMRFKATNTWQTTIKSLLILVTSVILIGGILVFVLMVDAKLFAVYAERKVALLIGIILYWIFLFSRVIPFWKKEKKIK